MRKTNHNDEQSDRDYCKYNCSTSNDGANLFRFLFAEITRNQNRDTHSKLDNYESDQIQNLASGRNSRKSGGRTKSSNDQQVNRAICRLQHQSSEYRQHKKGKFFQNAPLRKICFICVQVKFSFPT